jgi:hypothetical protein
VPHDAAAADPRPFSIDEYRERARRVRAEMARRSVDVLLVLSPANLYYLTGFESIWYPPRAPVGVIVSGADERLVFIDYERHETLVERVAHYDEAVFYGYANALDEILSAVRARGWATATIGIERWTQSPGAPVVDHLADGLAGGGAQVVAGDWIVDRVRLVKSPAELEYVRQAGRIIDAAIGSLSHHGFGRPRRLVSHPLAALSPPRGGRRRDVRGCLRRLQPLSRRRLPHLRDWPRSPRGARDPGRHRRKRRRRAGGRAPG